MNKARLLFILSFLLFTLAIYSNMTSAQERKYKVKVSLAAPGGANAFAASYFNRELRSLMDIELVEGEPEWEIIVSCIEANTDPRNIAVTISAVIVKHFDALPPSIFREGFKETGIELTSRLYWRPTLRAISGSKAELQDMCRSIITSFDADFLEMERKYDRMMKEVESKRPPPQ